MEQSINCGFPMKKENLNYSLEATVMHAVDKQAKNTAEQ